MAVIRAQETSGGRKHQAVIRKGGFSLSRVFWRIREAEDWARRVEDAIASAIPERPFDRKAWLPLSAAEAEAQSFDDSKPHAGWTLHQALQHYMNTVTPAKKGLVQERKRIKQWMARDLAKTVLSQVTAERLQDHVDARAGEGRAAPTVRNEVLLLSALYRHAVQVWRLPLTNPVASVRLPSLPAGRQHRLEEAHEGGEDDEARLLAACRGLGGTALADMAVLAIETGLRQGEMLSLTARHIKRRGKVTTIELPDSKNGHARRVVANARAAGVLAARAEAAGEGRLFPIGPDTLRHQWNRARAAAGLHALRFHDLRHEALSRMADRGLNIGELQAQSGHRTAQVLLRYVNARAGDIAKKLG